MKKKRILSLLLTLCFVTSLLANVVVAADVGQFTDVRTGSWYYDDVDVVTSKGYFIGTSDTQFQPAKFMNRAMFVVVLARMDGAEVDNSVSVFDDVPANMWYTGAVTWAAERNIVDGYNGKVFGPADSITREQMCAIMDRYINYYSEKTGQVVRKTKPVTSFGDSDTIRAYAKDAVNNCLAYGLIDAAGYGDGNFYPRDNSTRAQVAKVIRCLAQAIKPDRPDPRPTSYTITYWDGDVRLGSSATEANWSAEKSFTTWDEQTKSDFVFVAWNTEADGSGTDYAANTLYSTTSSLNLYAQWMPEEDYIGIAVKDAMDQVNESYLNSADISVSEDTYALVNPVVFNVTENPADTRTQNLTAQAGIGDDIVTAIIDVAASTAIVILDPEYDVSLADVKEFVKSIINEVKDEAGIEGDFTRETIEDIANRVYDRIAADGRSLWANFRVDGKYVTDDVTITVGSVEYTISYTISVDQASGTTSFSGNKKEAIKRVGATLAREIYASLKEHTEWTSVVDLTGTVTFTFTDPENDLALATVNYPHVYPVEVGLTLDGGSLVEYKFDGKNFAKLNITEDIQSAYVTDLEAVIQAALKNERVLSELNQRVENALTANNVIDALRSELGAEVVNPMLNEAVEAWVAANTSVPMTRALPNYYLPYEFFWGNDGKLVYDDATETYKLYIGDELAARQILGNNAALHDLIVDLCDALADKVIDKANTTPVVDGVTAPNLVDYIIDKANTTPVVDGVAVPGLVDHIINKTRTTEVITGVTLVNLPDELIRIATEAAIDRLGAPAWAAMPENEKRVAIKVGIQSELSGSDYSDIPESARNYLVNVCGMKLGMAGYESYTVDGLVYEVIKAVLDSSDYASVDAALRDYLKNLCGKQMGFVTGDYTTNGLIYEAIKVELAKPAYAGVNASLRTYLEKLCGVELGFESGNYTVNGLVYEAIKVELNSGDYDDIPASARSYLANDSLQVHDELICECPDPQLPGECLRCEAGPGQR